MEILLIIFDWHFYFHFSQLDIWHCTITAHLLHNYCTFTEESCDGKLHFLCRVKYCCNETNLDNVVTLINESQIMESFGLQFKMFIRDCGINSILLWKLPTFFFSIFFFFFLWEGKGPSLFPLPDHPFMNTQTFVCRLASGMTTTQFLLQCM